MWVQGCEEGRVGVRNWEGEGHDDDDDDDVVDDDDDVANRRRAVCVCVCVQGCEGRA